MTYLSNYVEQSPFQEVTSKSCVTFHNIPIPYIEELKVAAKFQTWRTTAFGSQRNVYSACWQPPSRFGDWLDIRGFTLKMGHGHGHGHGHTKGLNLNVFKCVALDLESLRAAFIIFKDPVRTAQWTLYGSVIQTSQSMLYREIIAVCSEIHTKHINTLHGQNVQLLNVKLVVHIVTTGL